MAIRLNSRCIDILSLLIEAEKQLPAASIAEQLEISPRMVRSSLALCEKWLLEHNFLLNKVPGAGISIVGPAEERGKIARMIREYRDPQPWLSPSERQAALLLTLLFAEKPLKLAQIQQALHVSRSTAINAIDDAGAWLDEHHLRLIRRPNFGFLVDGAELDWREAIVSVLIESCGVARLIALFRGKSSFVDVPYCIKTGLEVILTPIWDQLDIALIKPAISDIESTSEGAFLDHAYLDLCAYLAVSVYRIKKGKTLPPLPAKNAGQLNDRQISTARRIADQIRKLSPAPFSENEIAWLAARVPETVSLRSFEDRPARLSGAGSRPIVQQSVEQILTQAAISLHPSIRADREVSQSLALALEAIIDNPEQKRGPDAPLLESLKDRYPYVHSVVVQGSAAFADSLGRRLTEMEIGKIMLCLISAMERLSMFEKAKKKVLVVCSAGVATAWLLVSRLRAEFPDIEVVDVISVLDLENRKKFDGVDFIVGTAPVKVKNIPSIQVNPLLGIEDVRNLRALFEGSRRVLLDGAAVRPAEIHLSDLITPATIQLGLEAKDWQEVVDKAGGRLVEMGAVEPAFVQNMKDIILEHGPYMVIWPGAVLLHAPPKGVRRLCMLFANLKEPVCFGHPDHDPVKVAVVLGAIDDHTHITALMELNEMMQDANARAVIDRTVHAAAILHWVAQFSK